MNVKQIREEIKAQNLNIHGMCEWLEKYGSDGDPIFYMGQEMTPTDLAYKLEHYTPALDVRISFYGTTATSSCGLRRNSNFAHMLKDRIDMFAMREVAKKKEERKPEVQYRVSWSQYFGYDKPRMHEKFFTRRSEAKTFFRQTKQRHTMVKFEKTTTELLGESDD